jgi:plasmid stability protein
MRTTIRIADEVFRAYKQRAATRGRTLAQEIEDVLRADLHGGSDRGPEAPFETLVFDGDGSPALVRVDDNGALQELMDAEAHSAGSPR